MQNCPSNFHSFSFQSSNFQFCQFSSLTFNFCQWRILLNPSYGLPLMSLKRHRFSFFFFSKLKEKKKKMYKKRKKRKEKENICSEIKTEESLHTQIPNLEWKHSDHVGSLAELPNSWLARPIAFPILWTNHLQWLSEESTAIFCTWTNLRAWRISWWNKKLSGVQQVMAEHEEAQCC